MLFLAGCQGADQSQDTQQASAPEMPDGVSFVDISVSSGINAFRHQAGGFGEKWFPEIMGAGGGFIDYNQDHWPDILLVSGGALQPGASTKTPAVRLLENKQDGTFEDVTVQVGLADIYGYGFGIAVADYDNDGDQDFALSTLYENLLFRNDAGRFVEIGDQMGFSDLREWSTGILFLDADNDGWVDLLVGNYVEWSPESDKRCTVDGANKEYCTPEIYAGLPLRLYRNVEGERFVNVSTEAGLASNPGKTLGLSVLDFNHDGLLDFVATNDTERDLLYENRGDGTFQERGMISGMALSGDGKASAGMGIDTGYIDGSGEPAILVGNFSRESLSVFQHQANGRFRNATTSSQIGRPSYLTLTFGLFLFDVELDGDLDLFVANGHVHESVASVQDGITFAQPPQLYINNGAGRFDEFLPEYKTVFSEELAGRGAAYADIDNDGDLDILITANNGSPRLWRNDSANKNAIQITLEGVDSNANAIGARLEVVASDQRQVQLLKSGSSYLSASSLRQTIGLGDASQIDTLLVHWSAGTVDTFLDVSINQHIHLKEGANELVRVNSF